MELTIITATFNSSLNILDLIGSLNNQTCKKFRWIVIDGDSTDNTVELIHSNISKTIEYLVVSESDFGIYDAINKGVRLTDTKYYSVVGSDDVLKCNFVKVVTENLLDCDVLVGNVIYNSDLITPRFNKPSWYFGQFSYIAAHSVGCVFRKSLHDYYGFYSSNLPIAADQLFILTLVKGGAQFKYLDLEFGQHGASGISSSDKLGVISEFARAQIMSGHSALFQKIILIIRIIRSLFSR